MKIQNITILILLGVTIFLTVQVNTLSLKLKEHARAINENSDLMTKGLMVLGKDSQGNAARIEIIEKYLTYLGDNLNKFKIGTSIAMMNNFSDTYDMKKKLGMN